MPARPRTNVSWSLYIHVPYCRLKCAYCDFFSIPLSRSGTDPALSPAAFVSAASRHIDHHVRRYGIERFDTAYVGGGTPTCLSLPDFENLLKGLKRVFERSAIREWTLEANPESMDADHVRCMGDYGLSRVSLGIQDLDNAVLLACGRHSTRQADILEALDLLETSWTGEKAADFICGLPGQKPEDFARALDRVIDTGLDHISLYDLTLEEGTPLFAMIQSGELRALDEDCLHDLKVAARETLAHRGFKRYEVSNYALPGHESIHNKHYWSMDGWIAAGPGASGSIPFDDGSTERVSCRADLAGYSRDPIGSSGIERIGSRDAAFEFVMMGMRTITGIDSGVFMERFLRNVESVYGNSLRAWSGRIIATPRGYAPEMETLDHINAFLRDCLVEMDYSWPP